MPNQEMPSHPAFFPIQDQARQTPDARPLIPVALASCPDYAPEHVEKAVYAALDSISSGNEGVSCPSGKMGEAVFEPADALRAGSGGCAKYRVADKKPKEWPPIRGCRVLVKPNLLKAHELSCTHPLVVKAACQWLLERGALVTVADSPGFGTARGVADSIGLSAALRPLGLEVVGLGSPASVAVGEKNGARANWGVSRLALESDLVLSVPRVKAHGMLGMTLAVKNMFGCVTGLRKAFAHTMQGNSPGLFESCLADLILALPPVAAVADGVTAMHVTGPSSGQPFSLGLIAASPHAVALDEALYAMLDADPARVPLRAETRRRGLPGSSPEELAYCLENPASFPVTGFRLPTELRDISFQPHRLFLSLCRRIWKNIRP